MIHPALWLLEKLHAQISDSNWTINIRALVNTEPHEGTDGRTVKNATKTTYNENIPILNIRERWEGGLFEKLSNLNNIEIEPSNIYFGVNPRINNNNSIKDIAGYIAIYLDLDDNKELTRDQRLKQVQFWHDMGLGVSLLLDSGNGYHAYWLLDKLEPNAKQHILRKMVAFSGCKDGGNVHDPTRILRLPGFRNVKNWFSRDATNPICTIVLPQNIETVDKLPRYDIETFNAYFPPSELEDIENYHAKAIILGEGKTLTEKLQALAQATTQARRQMLLTQTGTELALSHANKEGALGILPGNPTGEPVVKFTPNRNVVPHIDEIIFPKGKTFLKKFCTKGWNGLSDSEKESIAQKLERPVSCSEMDMILIIWLIRQKYTCEAVIELYQRPNLGLWRQDKMDKNPCYLQMTYDKALESVRNNIGSADPDHNISFQEPKVFVMTNQAMAYQGTNGVIEKIVSAEMVLNEKFIDEDNKDSSGDREWFGLSILTTTPNGIRTRDILANGHAFNSIKQFKSQICGNFCRLLVTKEDKLAYLHLFLEEKYPNVPTRSFHSKLGYHKSHMFVFPTFIVDKEGPKIREEKSLQEYLAKKYLIFNWFCKDIMPISDAKATIEAHWADLLKVHLPRLVASVLGLTGSSIMRHIFEEKLEVSDFHVPTVNIRGSSSSGKSETIKHLLRFSGLLPKEGSVSVGSTEFSIKKIIELYGFIPVFIDEFKGDNTKKMETRLEEVRKIIKNMYTGETELKGTADLGIRGIKLHGSAIVAGELAAERIGNVAEVSRMIPINTDEYDPKNKCNMHHWIKTKDIKWERISPWLFHYALNLDPQTEYNKFVTMRQAVMSKVENSFASDTMRIAHNLTVLIYGCSVIDGFIHSLAPNVPTLESILDTNKNLIEYLCSWASENKHSLIAEDKSVYAHDEFFNMITTYRAIQDTRDKIIADYAITPHFIDEKKDELYLWIQGLHKMVKEYEARQNVFVPDENKIRSVLRGHIYKKAPWLVCNDRIKKLDGHTCRCLVVKLSTFRFLSLWPKPEEKQVPGTEKIELSRTEQTR